jgi:hypothetical protein
MITVTEPVDGANADEKTQALIAADRLIDRLRQDVVEGLKPDGPADPNSPSRFDPEDPDALPDETNETRAFGQIVEDLETAPEVDQVRAALDEPPIEKTRIGPGGARQDA